MTASHSIFFFNVETELGSICLKIKPSNLVAKSPHHVYNTRDLVQQTKYIKLEKDECISSYNVEALFTSVPIEVAIKITKEQSQQDKELHLRASMTADNISLLDFFLKNTYFTFKGRHYEQVEVAAMGSPINTIIANLFI